MFYVRSVIDHFETHFNTLLWVWIGLAVATFILLLFVTAPFGRHTTSGLGTDDQEQIRVAADGAAIVCHHSPFVVFWFEREFGNVDYWWIVASALPQPHVHFSLQN